VPVSVTVCGEPVAVSVYVTVAAREPAALGVKVMVLVQLAPTASGLVQVDADLVNEPAPGPVMVVEAVKVTAEDVLFTKVMTCVAAEVPTGVEGNERDDGVMLSPELAPVPERLTVCGAAEAESV
jgi:hypothetical protein